MNHIPQSWQLCSFHDIGEIVSGGTPSTKNAQLWGDEIPWISPSDLTGYKSKFIQQGAKSLSSEGLANSSAKLMPSGSIHFSSRAPIGYVAISSQSLCTNQGFKSLVPAQGIFNEYVYFYLKSIKGLANSVATGTTFKELSGKAFSALPFPLPPLNEQKRIVAKIEELFSELDAGEENLKNAKAQLGLYRQSLLKQAFEGKLTEKWRAENPDKLESPEQLLARIQEEREAYYLEKLKEWEDLGKGRGKPKSPPAITPILQSEHKDLCPLPSSWAWVPLSATNDFFNGDRSKNYPNRNEYVSKGVAWINTGHIDSNGTLSLDRMNYITRDKYKSLSGGRIEPGDLVYCLRGATFGKTAFVTPLNEGAIASSLMIIRPLNKKCTPFIFHYLLSPLGKAQLQRFDNGSAQPNLSAASVALYHYPLCGLEEQQEIVRIIDEQFEAIEQNEKEIDAALKRSESLRQAILKKAFCGQLVPQDPDDEPAAVLLERIRQEREAAKLVKKKTRRKKLKEANE